MAAVLFLSSCGMDVEVDIVKAQEDMNSTKSCWTCQLFTIVFNTGASIATNAFDSIKNFQGGTINEELSVINARDRVGNNTKNLVNCYLRFTYNSTNAITPYINPAKFISSDDGYYYYKKIFNVGEIVRLIDFFEVGKISIEEYLNGIDVNIKVDVMQASKNLILESFPTAPIEWINSIT